MKFAKLLAPLGLLLLAACAAPTETADPTDALTPATSTAQPSAISATAAVAGRATGVASSAVTFGRADDGLFFHGAPDAPVTLIDYADFL
jgi:hypothetical protein